MTRTLLALLTLAACGPERDQSHDLPCEEMVTDWIEVPEVVEMRPSSAGSAAADPVELDGQGSVCAVSCSPWERAGIILHTDVVDVASVADGTWIPEEDDIGPAVVLPATVWSYSANGAEVGDASTCTITSTAGEDVIEVVIAD